MDIITRLNWVDILSVIVIIRISYVSLSDGLSHEIFPLIGVVITAALSIRYYPELSLTLKNISGVSYKGVDFISLICLIAMFSAIFRLARMLVDSLIKVTWHPVVDSAGGLIFGVMKASIVVSMVLVLLMLAPLTYLQYSIADKSYSGRYLLKIAPGISSRLAWALPVLVK